MERVRHAANSLERILTSPGQWDRYECDLWVDGDRFKISHDRTFGPLYIGRRGLRPIAGLQTKALYLEEYLTNLPRAHLVLPASGAEYFMTRPLLIDLKGSWASTELAMLPKMLTAEGSRNLRMPDIFCTENWQLLDTLRGLGVGAHQIAYSIGKRRNLQQLAAYADAITYISVDYKILRYAADLDPFHAKGIKIFIWNLPDDFPAQEKFRALRERGFIQGLTLNKPAPRDMYT